MFALTVGSSGLQTGQQLDGYITWLNWFAVKRLKRSYHDGCICSK